MLNLILTNHTVEKWEKSDKFFEKNFCLRPFWDLSVPNQGFEARKKCGMVSEKWSFSTVYSDRLSMIQMSSRPLVFRIFSLALLFAVLAQAQRPPNATDVAPQQEEANRRLHHALDLAELYEWADAATDFEAAEKEFGAIGDHRNAFYAHLGNLRATIERHNLPLTSAELSEELKSSPLLQSDKQLRLFCLIIKGDVDQEIDVRAAKLDWEQVRTIATELGNDRWQNRALAQLGISAFYERDLATASRNVATALSKANSLHDIGAQVRFTTVLGKALIEAKMYERALPYLDKALALTTTIPDSGYPTLIYQAKLEALIGLKRYEEAQKLSDEVLKQITAKYTTGPQASFFPLAARIALGRGDVETAIRQLQRSIAICKAEGYQQMESEPESMLAEIYRERGDLKQAERFAAAAATSSQSSGDKWSLPERFKTLAELQVTQGKYIEADQTFDKAGAFIDSGLANSSSVLEKTALIKASGALFPEHFALVASHLQNPIKAFSIVERVRGRVNADLLISGSVSSPKAEEVEHRIATLQLQMMSAKTNSDVNRLRDQIFGTEELRWVTPGVSILKHKANEAAQLSNVRRELDSTTTILEYVVAEPTSYCLVLTNGNVRILPLAGESRIDSLVAAYLKAIQGRLPAHVEARQLFDALLGPVRESESKRNIVIVADGLLHLVPFDALEDSSGAYLMESHVISYTPSATTWYLLNREAHHTSASMRPLLALGGIPYSQTTTRSVSLVATKSSASVADLPYSKQEVLDASASLSGNNTLLLGQDATEAAFKHAVHDQYGTIHIAAHGLASDPDPDNAALVLLPDPAVGEDGLLHATEIATMRLNTNLVVLSACDTPIGPIQGEEGISTLANSFLLAGAKSVVSTLWSADDTSSLFLMKQFYSGIAAGENPAVALANAKKQMLKAFSKEGALPYYWAGFKYEGVTTPSGLH